jgi:hypothetical protein
MPWIADLWNSRAWENALGAAFFRSIMAFHGCSTRESKNASIAFRFDFAVDILLAFFWKKRSKIPGYWTKNLA